MEMHGMDLKECWNGMECLMGMHVEVHKGAAHAWNEWMHGMGNVQACGYFNWIMQVDFCTDEMEKAMESTA